MTLCLYRNGCSVPAAGDQETVETVQGQEPTTLVLIFADALCVVEEADVRLALVKVEDIILSISKN